jgi:hypothetical protein
VTAVESTWPEGSVLARGGRDSRHPARGARGAIRHPHAADSEAGCRRGGPVVGATGQTRSYIDSLPAVMAVTCCGPRHVCMIAPWRRSPVRPANESSTMRCSTAARAEQHNERTADQDQWIHESMGGWATTRESRFAAQPAKGPAHWSCEGRLAAQGPKRPAHQSCAVSSRRTGAKTTGSPVVRGVVSPHRGQNNRLTSRARGRFAARPSTRSGSGTPIQDGGRRPGPINAAPLHS